ncbi:hypothetical protein Patl1_10839 [Pistacia atlantica]|uniref:Uncharacterized protein n=1 Tax=Pistacia atlantica TaxID=434234 RepID=A0ACC1A0K0_9ROSI|nr:hypothetical protein Patl1_10839 [Pistacia atlantica]
MSGRLQGQQVEVLIDGGSTHNFIQERVAIHLGLPIVASTNFNVMIGNGDHMCCSRVCANASLQLDGMNFQWIYLSSQSVAQILFWECSGWRLWVLF